MTNMHIMRVINYIEAHLKEDTKGVLDNATLASVAGYSEFHFLRLFRQHVHLTPADYIRKRRLSEIVRRIGQADCPISQLAFEYGFNSKENFTRAFKKEHHILPTEFREADCSLRLFAPFEFRQDQPAPAVSIGYLAPFSLVVYSAQGEQPPQFWNRYNAGGFSKRLSGGATVVDFGAMAWNEALGRLDYHIGIRQIEAKGNLYGTTRLEIEGGLYGIFDTPPASQHDFVASIKKTWDWIYGEWLPNSGYRRGGGYEMECYTEAEKSFTERIYVPLVKK